MSPGPPSPVAQRSSGDRAQLAIVVGVSLVVRVGYLLIKPSYVMSVDVGMWQQAAGAMLRGENPYRTDTMAFLPLWPSFIWIMAQASRATGVAFATFLWGLLILAESALLLVCFRLLLRWVSSTTARNILLLAIALNPAAIFQVTQHGNIDVIFMLWVMLATAALIRFHDARGSTNWLLGTAWLGLGIMTKTAPIALAPLLAAGANRLSRGSLLRGMMLLIGPAIVGFGIILPFAPAQVWRMVVQYRSVHGFFGISGILNILDGVEFPAMGPLVRLQAMLFNIGLPVAMIAIAGVLWRKGWADVRQILLSVGLILISILIFGIGFGSQHIYWLIPPLAVAWGAIDDPRWRRLLVVGWGVVAITYMFMYLMLPTHGELLRVLYPNSDLLYRASLMFVTPADLTLMQLPMFCVFVAILIEGMRQMRRITMAESVTRSARSLPADPSPLPSASDMSPPP